MAAVLALVFLFALASVGLIAKVMISEGSWVAAFAIITFVMMAGGVFVGLFKMSRQWEGEGDAKH